MNQLRFAFRWLASSILLTIHLGCATHADRMREARHLFYAGDIEGARTKLKHVQARNPSDRDLVALELAMVQLFSGQAEQAERTWREVRDSFDHLEQTDVAESARALLTDDRAQAYAGESYEKVMIRVMLTLANLMGDGNDALAYSHQINAQQRRILAQGVESSGRAVDSAYRHVALGAYLHGVLRESSHADFDDVERAFAEVVSWEPEFRAGQVDLHRARYGRHSSPGNGVLYVFAFVGRGPHKIEVLEQPTSQAMLIADRILSGLGEYSLPPTIAPIKVPAIATYDNDIAAIQVDIDGHPAGATETITDVGRMAREQHNAVFPNILARAVVRRTVKKAAVYAVKKQLEPDAWMNLALDAAGVAWEATESADTRCWSLLPDRIQVLRLELPAGRRTVGLRPMLKSSAASTAHALDVRVEDGRNSFVLGYFPANHLAGKILVSGHFNSDQNRALSR